ncbi:MAG TPA: NAD(P)-dependent oxidoreductase [Methylocella sp.]|nr:NAD(P)-dependent oxidoreductase [Methylocella sp.]
MKIFVAGATGVIGRQLLPILKAAGHEVVGLTRSPAKALLLQRLGAKPVIADALSPEAIMRVMGEEKPEVVIHELTSIKKIDFRNFDMGFSRTNRLRTEGMDHLLAAARAAGARRFIAQSFAGWPYARYGGTAKSEEDPLDPFPPPTFRRTLGAIIHLENAVKREGALDGLVLRYGVLYGPGTAINGDGWMVSDLRRRRIPVVGDGGGVWSFIHVLDAARFTFAAVTRGERGIYNIVDDEPSPISEWLPELAKAVNARPPWWIPAWAARFMMGDAVVLMTDIRGASNLKAKRVLEPNLKFPSWRVGFRTLLNSRPRTKG